MKRNFLFNLIIISIVVATGCNRVSKYPIDDPARVKIDNTLLGKWTLQEDTLHSNYFVVKKKDDFKYAISYMNKAGTNVQYEDFEAFLSRVSNARYLNVQYYYKDVQGYFFLKIIDINESGDIVTTATVADTNMLEVTRPAEIRGRISRNVNNPAFYSDTAHFIKIKGF